MNCYAYIFDSTSFCVCPLCRDTLGVNYLPQGGNTGFVQLCSLHSIGGAKAVLSRCPAKTRDRFIGQRLRTSINTPACQPLLQKSRRCHPRWTSWRSTLS